MPAGFTTFSNVLFDADYDSDSSDDQSLPDEDVHEKIYSNPLFDEEIIPMKSLRTHDSSLPISSKIDSLLEEFAGELTLLKSIPPGIDETDCHPEEEIRLTKRLLYGNSSPRPPEEFVSDNSNADIKSFSPSPIPIKDSDSHMEEIDLSLNPPSSESLFAYVVWIFLPFLVYSVVPHYLLSFRNKDIIFDPGICKSTFSRPDISHRCGTVKKF
nr:hypothetical protein [Tanacetum cinerariifolium]